MKILGYIKEFSLLCEEYPDWIPINNGFDVLLGFLPSFVLVVAVFAVLSLINHIFFNISVYHVFDEYKPVTAVVMTALSVMFGGIMSLAMLIAAVKPEKTVNIGYNVLSEKEKIGTY